jgi:hypothetical protein
MHAGIREMASFAAPLLPGTVRDVARVTRMGRYDRWLKKNL